jgi:AcrR family transcriptional regulator
MRTLPHPFRLAGEELREHRHVCVFVDGPADAHELLLPFILEGFDQGDRAVHLVDPKRRDAHIERLRSSGIDVSAATASRQLEVLTWEESYLRGGSLDGSAQLSFVRDRFAEGPGLGYSRTRLIGSMEWALGTETASELLGFEARVDELLRKLPDVAICTYDLNRQSARTIAEVFEHHPVAIVGGVLRTSHRPAPASARDRLLVAASDLFQEKGIQATGVDALIGAAGVAKATFYRHFPSKDDLIVAWLRGPRARWLDRVRAEAEATGAEGLELVGLFFDALGSWLEDEDYRGCPYLNTAIEITEPRHPARGVAVDYLQEVEDYLAGLVAAAGYRHAPALGAEVQTLVAGSITLAVARRSTAPVRTARAAALSLLDAAPRD